MVCHFCYDGAKYDITIKLETEQNMACHFPYDGAKYGVTTKVVTD
jgi:hypothetical protein